MNGCGYTRLEVAGTIDGSNPIVLYGFATNGTTGSISVYDGQDGTGTLLFNENNGQVIDLGCGVVLKNGGYMSFTGDATYMLAYYERAR